MWGAAVHHGAIGTHLQPSSLRLKSPLVLRTTRVQSHTLKSDDSLPLWFSSVMASLLANVTTLPTQAAQPVFSTSQLWAEVHKSWTGIKHKLFNSSTCCKPVPKLKQADLTLVQNRSPRGQSGPRMGAALPWQQGQWDHAPRTPHP